MKISLNWLKTFAPSLSESSQDIANKLTSLGLEVEALEEKGVNFTNVVVGKVLDTKPHPNADRLTVCKVSIGDDEPLQIVCGAPNVAANQLVAVAKVGAVLQPGNEKAFKIKKSKIRGELSQGMICAEDELGLSDNHEGIMVLDESHKIGALFENYITKDTVFEIGITPNRPDALSHFGVARDLIGYRNVARLDEADIEFKPAGNAITVEDKAGCPIYTGVIIRGATIKESPSWLKAHLQSIDIRPINNVVDITNYILHALGHPLHAFDLKQLAGEKISVKSDLNTPFTTLDDKSRQITPGMVMICDAEKPVAVGGVMGGQNSEISEQTTDILLEAAYFKPNRIRKTSKTLGISTDSSYRFERGVDYGNIHHASKAAVKLILELAGGKVEDAFECLSELPEKKPVQLRPDRVNQILGASIAPSLMIEILENLGFKVLTKDLPAYEIEIPSFRPDVEQEIDLIEEIARIYGYDNISASENLIATYPDHRDKKEYFSDYVRQLMIGLNFKEVLTNPMLQTKDAGEFSNHLVKTLNPISEDMESLRPSLVPSFLKIISRNCHFGTTNQQIFEVGHTFEQLTNQNHSTENEFVEGYIEKNVLCFALTGQKEPQGWNQHSAAIDFFDLKGVAELLLRKLKLLEKSKFMLYNRSCLLLEIEKDTKGKTTDVVVAGKLEEVSTNVLKRFDISQPVFVAEFDVNALKVLSGFDVDYEPPAKYPVVQKDLAFLISKDIRSQDIIQTIKSCSNLIKAVNVFDVYEGNAKDSTFNNKRSIAFSLTIVCQTHTLTDNEIHALLNRIIDKVSQKHGAALRDA